MDKLLDIFGRWDHYLQFSFITMLFVICTAWITLTYKFIVALFHGHRPQVTVVGDRDYDDNDD